MRSSVLIALAFFLGTSLHGQIFNPVKWSTSYQQVSDKEFDLIFTADIKDGWVIYSQYLESDEGPVPTAFYFDEGSHYELLGKTEESGNRKEAFDKVFEMTLVKFSKKAVFTRRVRVNDSSQPVKGYLEFMTCDDERCLPPTEEEFSFLLETQTTPTSTGSIDKIPPDEPAQTAPATLEKTEPEKKEALTSPAENMEVVMPASETEDKEGLLDPVKWSIESRKLNDDLYEIRITAHMDEGWSIYSQYTDDNGPIPTAFFFDEGPHYTRIGEVAEEGKKKEGPDPLFGGVTVIKYIESPVVFRQKVEASDPSKAITGVLEYMCCDDKRCLTPTEVPFRVKPAENIAQIDEEITETKAPETGDSGITLIDFPKPGEPLAQCGEIVLENKQKAGYWSIFVLGFIGGLLALLTPCVFPMIPLTVSFFTKSSGNRQKGFVNASMYGFFILAVYLILSAPFHLMDTINPDILNDISTNVWLNLFFFAVFLFFAFSFFGYYELTLPSSWTNRVSAAEGVGGVIGIFFMALTLALVSFSCTGPILGSLLAGALSADGGAWQLTAGMGGFGLALALPFALFAAFPGWMNSLPKSGGWLNTVKVVLGFLELALALKFLSNADLVKHWGFLKIELFLALWILIFLGLGLYLFGKLKFPHDSPTKKLSPARLGLGVLSIGFAMYLATGFLYDQKAQSYRSLKLLSGLAPPACYSWFQPCDCPQNLNCFKDFEEGLAFAKKVNKPIMIDFTGHACVNCRKMEEHVWPEPQVYRYLKDDYILISLYVDEKIELPEEEQLVVEKATGGTRKLRNYGHKWSHFQVEYFNTNSQPYYVLLSPDGDLLNQPVGYTPDAETYSDFLQCGLESFKKVTEENSRKENKQLGER